MMIFTTTKKSTKRAEKKPVGGGGISVAYGTLSLSHSNQRTILPTKLQLADEKSLSPASFCLFISKTVM
jgi:hypothetical protein